MDQAVAIITARGYSLRVCFDFMIIPAGTMVVQSQKCKHRN